MQENRYYEAMQLSIGYGPDFELKILDDQIAILKARSEDTTFLEISRENILKRLEKVITK